MSAGALCAVTSGSLILVNALHPCLRARPEHGLVPVGETDVTMDSRAAALLERLMGELHAWDEIVPVSGWRAREEQQAIWDDSMRDSGEVFTRQFVAAPGCSEHQTGLAIDLGVRCAHVDFIRPDFPNEGVCAKVARRAARYGFVLRYPAGKEAVTGIAHEPWHFRYVGAPHARIMEGMGLTLEEYHAFLKDYPCGGRPYRYEEDGRRFSLCYLPAREAAGRLPELERQGLCMVSGDNMDGFVVTVLREGGGAL